MSFHPLGDRVLVAADPPQEKIGSIIIPRTAGEKLRRENGRTGIVRYIGPGMLTKTGERWPMPDVKIGDRVLFLDQPWPTTRIEDEELLCLRDDGLLAVIENDR